MSSNGCQHSILHLISRLYIQCIWDIFENICLYAKDIRKYLTDRVFLITPPIYAKFGLFKKKFFKFFEKQAIYFETHYSKNSISIFKNGHYKYQNDEHHLLYTNLSQAIPLTAFCLPAFWTINYNIIRFKLKCQHCNLDRNLKRAIQTNANLPSTFDQITTVLYILSNMSHYKIWNKS